jgi:hypothetical protein
VAEASTLELALELYLDAEPIAGRLRRSDGRSTEFVGWLELTHALEDARQSDPETTASPH